MTVTVHPHPYPGAPEHLPAAPHRLPAAAVVEALDVDPARGLDRAEVERRRAVHGRNELAEAPRVPAWRRFLAPFGDRLNVILLGAAGVAFVVSAELKTPIVVLSVVLLNAIIGFIQENRAEASLDALRRMLVTEVRVRRDGAWTSIPVGDLVPGDVVAVEAGDRVPADARLLLAANLEVDESALTGESVPVAKSVEALDDDLSVGDRTSMVHMNATVTRGRGEAVVTSTGMGTEVGRIAELLRDTLDERTPLQDQLDGLAKSLARMALVVVTLVLVVGALRGRPASDLLLTAVALAVASIPEGLPAVTAVTLALGVSRMAKRNAIVKRLASVETLGCTTVVCSDKTGTLTLNEMTAVSVATAGARFTVSGEGYDPTGTVGDGAAPGWLHRALLPAALCNDAVVAPDADGRWALVGDPTEGALVALAGKAGLEVDQLRRDHPRLAELPFDSRHKLMATVHDVEVDGNPDRLVLFVKGAPDAMLQRATSAWDGSGAPVPVAEAGPTLDAENHRMADEGLRVLALGWRHVSREEVDAHRDDLLPLVDGLTIAALVGIVDPPRPEVAGAVGAAAGAGVRVKVITGDHATTAAAVGRAIGLRPDGDVVAVTGADLDRMDDDELAARIDGIDVFARVAPEHKLRLVTALQRRGEVVAMTGDGVNDAPALRRADMGVAMGITGTEVTKEAATMVLADDHFGTIVEAVRRGRTIYGNIVTFVRFQLSTTLGFAAVFLAAAALGLAGGSPFAAIAILWVNLIVDGPPAMALAMDEADDDVMARPPRRREEPILTRDRWGAIALAAVVTALGTLAVLAWAPGPAAEAGEATVAGTMAFTTFVLAQLANLLNVRSDRASVFRRRTLTNRWLWAAVALVLVLQVAVTEIGPLQRLFDTTSLTPLQWLVAAAVASSVIAAEEVRKAVVRRHAGNPARSFDPAAR